MATNATQTTDEQDETNYPTADDPTDDVVGDVIEAKFEHHNVTAHVVEDRKMDSSADWGVICDDCGRAQDFHIVLNGGSVADGAPEGAFRVSPVFVESLEDRRCESYVLPDGTNAGPHSIEIDTETPGTNRKRNTVCTDCGRTTKVTAKPEYASNSLDRFARKPCTETFTDKELSSGVFYPSIDSEADADQLGIENWSCSSGRGKGRKISRVWSHPHVPYQIVLKSDRASRYVEFTESWSSYRAPTVARLEYEDRRNDEDKDWGVGVDVLRFMQATNEMEEGDYERLSSVTDATFDHIVDTHDLDRTV
jgi:hypothetical protein